MYVCMCVCMCVCVCVLCVFNLIINRKKQHNDHNDNIVY